MQQKLKKLTNGKIWNILEIVGKNNLKIICKSEDLNLIVLLIKVYKERIKDIR